MGDRIELPSGGWVELKDMSDVRTGTRKKLLKEIGVTEQNLEAGFALVAGLARISVERYQVPYAPFHDAIRVNMIEEDWDELRIADSNVLTDALEPVRRALFPEAPTPDNMKPGSPTQPAGE